MLRPFNIETNIEFPFSSANKTLGLALKSVLFMLIVSPFSVITLSKRSLSFPDAIFSFTTLFKASRPSLEIKILELVGFSKNIPDYI